MVLRLLLLASALLLPVPASAGPIVAPIEGNISVGELRALLLAGPLTWATDGDMVVAEYWDEEPGVGATVRHPGYLLERAEGPDWTSATLTLDGLLRVTCGRWQLDFERYPLDGSTLKSLVIDAGTPCEPTTPSRPTTTGPPHDGPSPVPVPEPAAVLLVASGLAVVVIVGRSRKATLLLTLALLLPVHAAAQERPRLLLPLYAGHVALQGADLALTREALARGGHEANPVMRGLAGSLSASLAVKTAGTAATIVLAERLWRDGHPRLAVLAVVLANGLMLAVVHHNATVMRAR